MKSLKDRIQNYKKNKSTWGKITDIIFVIFIVAMFIPQSRLAIGGFVNRIKSMVIEPSVKESDDTYTLTAKDYDWPIVDINGIPKNLSDFKNKVIFLNFWATWCPPCIGEMPSIQSLYDSFKDNDQVVFLLVSNENQDKVKAFIEKKTYDFPVYTSRYQAPSPFLSQAIPTTFLISKKGIIKVKETGAVNWGGKKMMKIIEELSAE